MTFIDMLFNRNSFPLPNIGAGRIHTIDDTEDEIPDHINRQLEILKAIEAGAGSANVILRRLAFPIPKAVLNADCEELAQRGLIAIKRNGHTASYCLAR